MSSPSQTDSVISEHEFETLKEMEKGMETTIVRVCLPQTDAYIEVPLPTLTSKDDPSLFYRIPRGMAIWDTAHMVSCNLEDILKKVDPAFANGNTTTANGDVKSPPTKKRAIELGAGAAPLPSIVLGELGYECLVTDFVDEVVAAAQRNVPDNLSSTMETAKLDFTKAVEKQLVGQFDIVVAADATYGEEEKIKQFGRTVGELVAPDGLLVLARKRRLREVDEALESTILPSHGLTLIHTHMEESPYARWREFGKFGHDAGQYGAVEIHVFKNTSEAVH